MSDAERDLKECERWAAGKTTNPLLNLPLTESQCVLVRAAWQAALAYRDRPEGYWTNKVANCKHAKGGTIVRAWRCQECKDLLPAHLHENVPAPSEGKEPAK